MRLLKSSLCVFMVLALGTGAAVAMSGSRRPALGDPVVGGRPQGVEDVFVTDPEDFRVETWVEGLDIPWSLVFLSEREALVSERPGRIRLIVDGLLQPKPYLRLDVAHIGEGGLMGLAVDPRFPQEPYVYAMHTARKGRDVFNRVIRLRHQGETGVVDKVLIDRIPGSRVHNGGRIGFGPDGMLYVCTGDVWNAPIAQDRSNLGGKILRITPDGAIPDDNPFEGSPVYSYGHRNPQGLAWHPATGDLFSSEHGPSGEFGLRGKDIINVVRKGGNYGWPLVIGKAAIPPYLDPIILWEEATPPSGMTFFGDRLYVATLRSEALMRIQLAHRDGRYEVTRIERLFARKGSGGVYGRLRDVVAGPDGNVYVLTSNRDGRGTPRQGDDKILRLVPKAF